MHHSENRSHLLVATAEGELITFPAGYTTKRQGIQREQLIKAGARPAHVVQAIYP
jgi:hypothetical protein